MIDAIGRRNHGWQMRKPAKPVTERTIRINGERFTEAKAREFIARYGQSENRDLRMTAMDLEDWL